MAARQQQMAAQQQQQQQSNMAVKQQQEQQQQQSQKMAVASPVQQMPQLKSQLAQKLDPTDAKHNPKAAHVVKLAAHKREAVKPVRKHWQQQAAAAANPQKKTIKETWHNINHADQLEYIMSGIKGSH